MQEMMKFRALNDWDVTVGLSTDHPLKVVVRLSMEGNSAEASWENEAELSAPQARLLGEAIKIAQEFADMDERAYTQRKQLGDITDLMGMFGGKRS